MLALVERPPFASDLILVKNSNGILAGLALYFGVDLNLEVEYYDESLAGMGLLGAREISDGRATVRFN